MGDGYEDSIFTVYRSAVLTTFVEALSAAFNYPVESPPRMGGSYENYALISVAFGFFAQTVIALGAGSTLASYGYVGNGSSHPLSSVTSYLSMNTTGWTLAQWQSVLPATIALSDELDWATMQSFIYAATSPIAVTFPNGSPVGVFNRSIVVCNQSVAFFGNGGSDNSYPGTTLKFTSGTDGIAHCSTTTTSKIELHDLAG